MVNGVLELILECRDYSLRNSFLPSFVSSLYENPKPNVWIKVAGYLGGGLKMEQKGNRLIIATTAEISSEDLEQLVILETGLWHEEFERDIGVLPSRFREVAEVLAKRYPGVRIPIAPRDFNYILIAVLLSKRANYDMVRRWCKEVWKTFDGDLHKMTSAKLPSLRKITRSYQIWDAVKSIKDLMKIISKPKKLPEEVLKRFGRPKEPLSTYILGLPPEVVRMILLSAWGVGAKVADSIILSTFKASNFIPCDIHLKRFITKLSLVERFKMPEKNLCKKFICGAENMWGLSSCPSSNCLRAILRPIGDLGGWMQTIAYLHGRDYCKPVKPICHECPVKDLCMDSPK